MKKFFITSTGTEIGKTLITSALAHQLNESGYAVKVMKPVISGYEDGEPNDTEILLKASGEKVNQKNIIACSPYRFREPASPDYAAKLERRKIDFEELALHCQPEIGAGIEGAHHDYMFVEGVGGLMVPLTERQTIMDLVVRLKYPVILVVGSYLGSISHSLSALEVLKKRLIDNVKIVISESEENPMPVEETANTIARFTDHPIMVVPRVAGDYRTVPDITSLVL